MTKTKSTKRALISSVIALIVCVSLLIGTTFAWFTDSVVSGRNVIRSGNLDVDLLYSTDGKSWNTVADATDVFAEDLWEPGYTKVVQFKVVNKGSLALRYETNVTIFDEEAGVNKAGKFFNLSDYINSAVVTTDATRDEILAMEGTPIANGLTLQDTSFWLKANTESAPFAIALWMPTAVGNEANHNGETLPRIELGIALYATQMTSEDDSFDIYYDEDAYWADNITEPVIDEETQTVTVSTASELAWVARMVNGTLVSAYSLQPATANDFAGWTVKLAADIDLANMAWTPIGINGANFAGTFDGDGHTVYNLNVRNSKCAGLFGFVKNGVITNLTVENATVYANDYAGAIAGQAYVKMSNCHVKNAVVKATPYLTVDDNGAQCYDGGAKAGALVGMLGEGGGVTVTDCTVENAEVRGYRDVAAAIGMVHSNNKVSNVTVTDATVSYAIVKSVYPYEGNKTNTNIGTVAGRVESTATVENCTSEGVLLKSGDTALAVDADSLATALTEGGKIAVQEDVTLTEGEVVTVPAGVTAVLELEENTVTGTSHKSVGAVIKNEGNLTIVGGTVNSTAENGGSAIVNSGTLTVSDAVLNGAPNADGSWPSYTVNNTGVMTVNNSTVTSVHGAVASYGEGAVLTLNNTDIEMSGIKGFTSHAIYTYDGGSVIVNGGTYANNATDQSSTGASLINGNVIVNSGTFIGRIENYYGTPVINGGTFSVNPTNYVADGYKVTDNGDGTWTVAGTPVSSGDSLQDALDKGDNVVFEDDIETEADTTAPYGNKVGIIQKGGVIDGNGKALILESYGDDYGIMTYGGTIKNLTVEGIARAIVTMSPTEDIILDNVVAKDGVLYPFNTTEHATVAGVDLIATNCTFGGWTSFAGLESASFTNCSFVYGNYYNSWPYDSLVKPYINTTFTNCDFAEEYYLDLSALGEDCKVTLSGCTVDGVAVTAENCTTLFGEVELPSGRTIADCLIFN